MSDLHPFTKATARRLWIIFIAILAATVLAGFVVPTHGPDAVSDSPGFNAWYGFLACVALVGGSRLLGMILKRRDSYYD